MSISKKIVLFVVSILVLSMAFSLFLVTGENAKFNEKVSSDRVKTAVSDLQGAFSEYMESAKQDANMIAGNAMVIKGVSGNDTAALKSALDSSDTGSKLSGIDIADKNGNALFSQNAAQSAGNLQTESCMQSALQGQSQTVLGQSPMGLLVCTSGAPIKDANGKVLGAVITRTIFDNSTFVDGLKTLHNTDFTIFAGDVRVATTIMQNGKRVTGTKLDPKIADVVLKQGQAYAGKATILGEQYLCYYEPLKSESGSIIGVLFAGLPQTEAEMATVSTLKQVMIFMPILFVVMLIILSIYMNKTIRRPMMAISAASTELARGNTDIDVDIRSKDELGVLSRSFKEMVLAIDTLLSDVKELTAEASDGNLSARADTGRHQGRYREIIDSVNQTLNDITEPEKEAADVLNQMKIGNLNASMTGTYVGDNAVFKDAINDTIFSIRGYITEIAEVLSKMAKGDLTQRISQEYKGDFNELKESINTIFDSFNKTLSQINDASDQVANGTKQVSAGSQRISEGATEQASAIEQLSATISGIAGQTRQNALSANSANELSNNAKGDALSGNEHMLQLLGAMREISESSDNISKIIKVIDDIAFQTNILALNAAVEAARAGIHGKGFAVVAEEVRNLAQKSANAAKETTDLIERSIRNVQSGSAIADQTALAMGNIVSGVEQVTLLVSSIATSSKEQALGIAQINDGIGQLSQVVQTNSATAQESAAASEELSGQAELLSSMVTKFNLA